MSRILIAFFCCIILISTSAKAEEETQNLFLPFEKKYINFCFDPNHFIYQRMKIEGYSRLGFSMIDSFYLKKDGKVPAVDVIEIWMDKHNNMRILHTNAREQTCVLADTRKFHIENLDALFGRGIEH